MTSALPDAEVQRVLGDVSRLAELALKSSVAAVRAMGVQMEAVLARETVGAALQGVGGEDLGRFLGEEMVVVEFAMVSADDDVVMEAAGVAIEDGLANDLAGLLHTVPAPLLLSTPGPASAPVPAWTLAPL